MPCIAWFHRNGKQEITSKSQIIAPHRLKQCQKELIKENQPRPAVTPTHNHNTTQK